MPENTTADNNPDKRALLRRAALEYHEFPKPGKIAIAATKQMVNQHDLALAYSPGVAAPCEEIVKDPVNAFRYTARGNLVAVISNGTAVLGLGDIGALASKPVMEGKGVLFKKFADVDVFDIEIDEKDPAKLVEVIAALEPTFGAINLEDIKAPDCFYVERELRKRMKIPVFHDDQPRHQQRIQRHGTKMHDHKARHAAPRRRPRAERHPALQDVIIDHADPVAAGGQQHGAGDAAPKRPEQQEIQPRRRGPDQNEAEDLAQVLPRAAHSAVLSKRMP